MTTAVKTLTPREEKTLYSRALQYASGRIDAQPEMYKDLEPVLFAMTVQNSYNSWVNRGSTPRWQGIEKTFEQYASASIS